MFTFVTISFNQEEYIIEHLESIKYQIDQFGTGRKINFILSDDSSSDHTVKFAEIWLEQHPNLFNEIQILVNKENQGIVKNYLQATAGVKTPRYKILGADDVYYKNNIFETIGFLRESDIIFTPSLTYNDEEIDIYWDLNNLLTLKKNEQVQKYLEHGYPFNTVGTFYKTSLIQNEGLREYISPYTWIEDVPSIYYLFNKKEALKYSIHYKPYIVYRNNAGISNNKENERNSIFAEEEELIKTKIGMAKFKKGLNLNYFRVAFIYKYISLQANWVPKNREIKRNLDMEKDQAHDYLNELKNKSKAFFQTTLNQAEEFS